jgi:hypothetical protein
MDKAGAIAFLTHTYRSLARQRDLTPNNPAVNQGLGALVATLQRWQAAGFGADLIDEPKLADVAQQLPRLCGAAECEMEKWWCRRILQSICPGVQALEAFWYMENYRELCRAEYSMVAGTKARRFAFLGSGALPMTAILLAQDHSDIEMRCIDSDGEACELSQMLVKWLNLSERVTVHQMRAEDYRPGSDEIVVCASLLQAPGLFPALERAGARRLVVRDAEGVYRFCYRPSALPKRGFVERARAPLSPKRINTSRYLEAC